MVEQVHVAYAQQAMFEEDQELSGEGLYVWDFAASLYEFWRGAVAPEQKFGAATLRLEAEQKAAKWASVDC